MTEKEKWLTDVPDPPKRVRYDPDKLKLWNDYWEYIIRQYEEEQEQERRSRRTQ